MLCCVFWLVLPKCLGGKFVSAASSYVLWMPALQHWRVWLGMQYLAHPFDCMCNVIVPPCFLLCCIGTLLVLRGDALPLDPISQLPWFDMVVSADVANVPKWEVISSKMQFQSHLSFRCNPNCIRCLFTWIDDPQNILFLWIDDHGLFCLRG